MTIITEKKSVEILNANLTAAAKELSMVKQAKNSTVAKLEEAQKAQADALNEYNDTLLQEAYKTCSEQEYPLYSLIMMGTIPTKIVKNGEIANRATRLSVWDFCQWCLMTGTDAKGVIPAIPALNKILAELKKFALSMVNKETLDYAPLTKAIVEFSIAIGNREGIEEKGGTIRISKAACRYLAMVATKAGKDIGTLRNMGMASFCPYLQDMFLVNFRGGKFEYEKQGK